MNDIYFISKMTHHGKLKLAFSGLGTGFGASAFVVFFWIYNNHSAGVWGLLSGIFAAVMFHLHYLHNKNKLADWHSVDTLQGIKTLGLIVFLVGFAGTAWHIFLSVYHHKTVLPVSESGFISAICSFMTAHWGFFLMIYTRKYMNEMRSEYPLLL